MTIARTYTPADFQEEFRKIVGAAPRLVGDLAPAVTDLCQYLSGKKLRPLTVRRKEFLALTNWKFRINAEALAEFYGAAAAAGYTFHYHFKKDIERGFDLSDVELVRRTLRRRGLPTKVASDLLRHFRPASEALTLEVIARECAAPSRLRKEAGDRDVEQEILCALFAAFIWTSLEPREMHAHFDPHHDASNYSESFWEQLHRRSPNLFNRSEALHVVRADLNGSRDLSAAMDALCNATRTLYERVNNYGFLAIFIEHVPNAAEWEVAARLSLFAEKHREVALSKAYFRWQSVRDETAAYVPLPSIEAASFELCNEGFTYRDTFVLACEDGAVRSLLLVFQKNERDETLIPCPACRSENVQGNSYPTLGVRSWECNNPLCPERSKYNRGKRYSFKGLAMQQAIEDPANEISVESVRAWSRDVVVDASDAEVADMLLRHYSMSGDTVHVHNWEAFGKSRIDRRIQHHRLDASSAPVEFWTGPHFRRYVHRANKQKRAPETLRERDLVVHIGDAAEALRALRANQLDGAVTSPPYYNARDYAQWPNMYCHLHDMFDINAEVFRVLKPGALYLYNVFDYFDNERTIVFSAMGQRRVLLSAYTVDLFRRIGFESAGAIVWDKGEIEGKRGFNGGNFSPYYQAPFNCWEHVLVFRKPGPGPMAPISRVIRQKPVIKMVRGENVHGHTAPFPDAIPELLLPLLPKRATILDPFAGSLTTGRVAVRHGYRSICIERSREYAELGLRMLREESAQLTLFSKGRQGTASQSVESGSIS